MGWFQEGSPATGYKSGTVLSAGLLLRFLAAQVGERNTLELGPRCTEETVVYLKRYDCPLSVFTSIYC